LQSKIFKKKILSSNGFTGRVYQTFKKEFLKIQFYTTLPEYKETNNFQLNFSRLALITTPTRNIIGKENYRPIIINTTF
jgi:hypothetical protein